MRWVEKYRPEHLDEMAPTFNIAGLEKHLASRDREQTFLFEGPRGTGKTTAAHIVGRSHPDNVEITGNPVREHDLADNNKIEDIRGIIDLIAKPPLGVNHVTHILDELHRIMPKTQPVLLKTMEHPPPYITFIMCTTEPQRLIPEIRDQRCHRVPFHTLNELQSKQLLAKIAEKEGLNVKEPPLGVDICNKIIELATGHPRTIIRMLQQAVDGSDIGLIDEDNADIKVAKVILNGIIGDKWNAVVTGLANVGDPERIRIEMTNLLRRRMVKRVPTEKEWKVFDELTGMIVDGDAINTLTAKCIRAMQRIGGLKNE